MTNTSIILIVLFIVFILIAFFVFKNSERISGLEKKSKTDTETLSNRITDLEEDVTKGFEEVKNINLKGFEKMETMIKDLKSFYQEEETLLDNLTARNRMTNKRVLLVEQEVVEIKDMITVIAEDNDMKEIKSLLQQIVDKQK